MASVLRKLCQGESVDLNSKTVVCNGTTYTYREFLVEILGDSTIEDSANSDSADLINAVEKAMDQRNSLNQQTMIELQSATSKRDQAYDMISNISKSLNQVSIGIVNNI